MSLHIYEDDSVREISECTNCQGHLNAMFENIKPKKLITKKSSEATTNLLTPHRITQQLMKSMISY